MRKLCGICFVLLLVPTTLPAIEISESELTRLEQISAERESINAQLTQDLAESRAALAKSEAALTESKAESTEAQRLQKKSETSLTEFASAAEAAIRQARAERDAWRAATVATGVVGLVAVGVALLLHR